METFGIGRTASAFNPPSRKAIPPFESLRAFDAVARLGGVRQAARSLGRDHAVVSRHLKTLEQWTGAKLIERTPGGVGLSDEGRRYHKDIAVAMDAIATSTIELVRRGHHNRLQISCAPGFALHWLSRRLGDFEQLAPNIEIELRPTDRRDDVQYDSDIEIRFAPEYRSTAKLEPGMRMQEVASIPIVAVASPKYLAKYPDITAPADLIGHRLLHEHDFDSWAHWLAAHGVHEELDLTGPRLWQGHLTLDAAVHGRGVAIINYLVAESFLTSGQLVEVGKDVSAFQPYTEGKYLILAHAAKWEAPIVRRYRRWLADELKKDLIRAKKKIKDITTSD